MEGDELKRILSAVLVGAVAFFVLGILLYVVALGGFYESNLGSATGVVREIPVSWVLVVSQLGYAAMLLFVFHYAEVQSARSGLRVGAAFGLLFGLAFAMDLYAVTHWSNVNVALVEPLVTTARFALAGAVMGWVLDRVGPSQLAA